jgi:excisionase family DNA binding protein
MHCTELHMPHVNVRTAAKLARRNRSTVTRMIERGHLSATKDDGGRYLIDPAELERVFGTLSSLDARTNAEADAPHERAHAHSALARELEMVRELLAVERAAHERERHTWDDERTFLRKLVEEHAGTVKLLTDERQKTDKPVRRWWRRS